VRRTWAAGLTVLILWMRACLSSSSISTISKDINDTYGRLFGDRVIGSVGQAVSQPARGDDAFGRYGGEEFLMLLPHTALFDSQKTAEAV